MLLRNLGNGDLDDLTMTFAEKFICRVYNVADAESCNKARATFSRCRSPEALPPTSDAALLMKGSPPSNDVETSQVERDKPYPSTSRDYGLWAGREIKTSAYPS